MDQNHKATVKLLAIAFTLHMDLGILLPSLDLAFIIFKNYFLLRTILDLIGMTIKESCNSCNVFKFYLKHFEISINHLTTHNCLYSKAALPLQSLSLPYLPQV